MKGFSAGEEKGISSVLRIALHFGARAGDLPLYFFGTFDDYSNTRPDSR